MKNAIAILLILVLAGFGLFAVDTDSSNDSAKIMMTSVVEKFSAFGVSSSKLVADDFVSMENFLNKVNSSIDTTIAMLDLNDKISVGFVSGVNNTKAPVGLYISTTELTSGSDKVLINVLPTYTSIPASANSKFGILGGTEITVNEKILGSAALAPAGTYTGTITIALKSS